MRKTIDNLERVSLLRNVEKLEATINDMKRRQRMRRLEWWTVLVSMIGCTTILVVAAFWSR